LIVSLAPPQLAKEEQLRADFEVETSELLDSFQKEEDKMSKRHEQEFLRLLEMATQRAVGTVNTCNCTTPYTCRHNKSENYKTRRPTSQVVSFRRNAKQLNKLGKYYYNYFDIRQ
jgi:hypothetical protein